MNFSLTKKDVTHFGGDMRTADMECRVTGFSVYLALTGMILFAKAYLPLTKDEILRLI